MKLALLSVLLTLASRAFANHPAFLRQDVLYSPNPDDGRFFFNLLTSTVTTTSTLTTTCTVSTTACGGKKRSILWKEEYEQEPERPLEESPGATEEQQKGKREASPQFYAAAYPFLGLQPSLMGHQPYLPPLYYNPAVHGAVANVPMNARLFFNLFTSTSTVTTTTTSRSTPSCLSSSSFNTC